MRNMKKHESFVYDYTVLCFKLIVLRTILQIGETQFIQFYLNTEKLP